MQQALMAEVKKSVSSTNARQELYGCRLNVVCMHLLSTCVTAVIWVISVTVAQVAGGVDQL